MIDRLRVARGIVAIPLACLLWLTALAFGAIAEDQHGTVRTYYIAADELDWDYVPSGLDKMMGMPPEGYAKIYTTRGPHQIGKVYRKAIYREYTDATFKHLKPRPARDAYLGIVGPIVRAEVGDFAPSPRVGALTIKAVSSTTVTLMDPTGRTVSFDLVTHRFSG